MTSRHGLALVLLATACSLAGAQDPNVCDVAGEAPDLLLGDIHTVTRWGTLEGKTAFSLGPSTCNAGSCQAEYAASTNRHPVMAQNMFRLRGGRFEQIGQGWVFHGFFALAQALCSTQCLPASGSHLGVHCSTTDAASYPGFQPNLGPRSEVDASTGTFVFPPTGQGQSGDVLFRRLQVDNDDLDPAQNPGAVYMVEGQLVAPDDAAGGKDENNASWRRMLVSGTPPNLAVVLTGPTRREQPAILAWRESDPAVKVEMVTAPDGLVAVGSRATDLGGGLWHYEYAVQNLTSHRSVGFFTVRLPHSAHVSGAGFHDVDYHSGEPYAAADWPPLLGSDGSSRTLTWATTPHDVDPNANALRWGTLYNFRFQADARPDPSGTATLGLFRPGVPVSFQAAVVAPQLCQAPLAVEEDCSDGADDDCDGALDCADADCCAAAACSGPDGDGDGFGPCDCDDANAAIWATPGEAQALTLSLAGVAGAAELHWAPPQAPGAAAVTYQALRAPSPGSFGFQAECLADPDPADAYAMDGDVPVSGAFLSYLVRAANACPSGLGTLGRASNRSLRWAAACP